MNHLEYFTNLPLYRRFDFQQDAKQTVGVSTKIFNSLYSTTPFDMYCVDCSSHSVFRPVERDYDGSWRIEGGQQVPNPQGDFRIDVVCSRNEMHKAMMVIRVIGTAVVKIGQYPSVADILTPDTKKYSKAIGPDLVKEWVRGIGLAAHGIGAGSYVYLRRVLEKLIESAYDRARTKDGWDEELYSRSRIAERIHLLKGELPEFLVDNRLTYSILSKGVHEMTEDECLRYFPVLNAAIELIGEELLAKVEYEKKRKETEPAIKRISSGQ